MFQKFLNRLSVLVCVLVIGLVAWAASTILPVVLLFLAAFGLFLLLLAALVDAVLHAKLWLKRIRAPPAG